MRETRTGACYLMRANVCRNEYLLHITTSQNQDAGLIWIALSRIHISALRLCGLCEKLLSQDRLQVCLRRADRHNVKALHQHI
jgi:hypothetical protein